MKAGIISRRSILTLSILAAIGLLLAGCTPTAVAPPPTSPAPAATASSPSAPTPTSKPAAEIPRSGGVLTRANYEDTPTMDVHQENAINSSVPLMPMYNGLIRFDPVEIGKIIPELAERWEASSDGLVYTFYLRKGVKWHDGKPLTAEDAAYSLMRLSHPKDFGTISPRGSTLVGAIKKAEAVDDSTVRVDLSYAQASFLEYAANGWIKMMPKHTIIANQGSMKHVANGTGPFKLKQFSRGVVFHMVKNEDYFMKGLPYLDEYKIYPIPDDTTRFVALRTGKVQATTLASRAIAPEQADWLKQNMADKITVGTHKSDAQWLLQMNQAREPWSDLRLRKALHLAISRKNLHQILKGYSDDGDVHYADGPWGIPLKELLQRPGWREPKDQDIAEAKRLMAEAGYAQGIKATLLTRDGSNFADFAQALQRDLGQVGIQTTIEQRTITDVNERIRKGTFDLTVHLLAHASDDTSTIYPAIYLTEKSRMTNGFSDKEIDAWFLEQDKMIDKDKRREIARKMAEKVMSQVASVPLVWQQYIYAHWKEVRNFRPGPGIFYNSSMDDVWLAKG